MSKISDESGVTDVIIGQWRQSKTVSKLMLVDEARPETLFIQVMATDENAFLVSFVEHGKRLLSPRLDLNNASFEVGQRVLEVKRSESDILMFEEWQQGEQNNRK